MGEGHSSYSEGDFGMMYLGRVEILPMGLFKDYSEGAHKRSTKPMISIGAGAAYLEKGKNNKGITGSTPLDGGTTDTKNVTADITLRLAGLSLEGAFFWREGKRTAGEEVDEYGDAILIEDPRNGNGYYVQGGFLQKNTELTARFSQILPTGEGTSLQEESEAGVGVNHYIGAHAFKVQADIFRSWHQSGFADGSTQFRLQMQMSN
jgi:hypothetical protein